MTMTRRDAIGALAAMTLSPPLDALRWRLNTLLPEAVSPLQLQGGSTPTLAPGAPESPERMALIDAFRKQSAGLESLFEAHAHESGWVMPYRLYRPRARGRHPLVVYLHGSGGLGTDNLKQLMTGNVFGTHVWVMPEHQERFPCFVLAPQTDRGWMRYGPPDAGDSVASLRPGLGEGARLVFEIIDTLVRTHPIDPRRLYITGQSMGGGGVWHMTAHHPDRFAAAVICCGVASTERASASLGTPVWNFHGAADPTVPVQLSRRRIEELRTAGGHPIATEYEGVGHNVWLWAFTEPALLPWVFAQRRSG